MTFFTWSSNLADWSRHKSSKSSDEGAEGICSTSFFRTISVSFGGIFFRTFEPFSAADVVVVVVVAVVTLYVRVFSRDEFDQSDIWPYKKKKKFIIIFFIPPPPDLFPCIPKIK
jgi:hypothetical protein